MTGTPSEGQYTVWRHSHCGGSWLPTSHAIKARSDKDAQARLKRRFQGAGFSSMSLVAVPCGIDPNQQILKNRETK